MQNRELIKFQTGLVQRVGNAISVTNKLLSLNKGWRIFVSDKSGFKELTDYIDNDSINGIGQHLGYHPDQVHSYMGSPYDPNSEIEWVIVEIFTKNIVFVLTKPIVTELHQKKVDNFLKNFDWDFEYDSYNTSSTLEDGIKNKSLRIEYLSRVLNFKNPQSNSKIYVDVLKLNLFFVDGFLVSFESPDGLNVSAREWKKLNPRVFATYEIVAKLYWGNNHNKVINELNIQADALFGLSQDTKNKFEHLHITKFGTVNFKMLFVCHFTHKITLPEFLEINHGRYEEISQDFSYRSDLKKYRLGLFTYEFLADGTLSNFYLTGK